MVTFLHFSSSFLISAVNLPMSISLRSSSSRLARSSNSLSLSLMACSALILDMIVI